MADLSASRSLPVRLPPQGLRIESLPLAGYTNYGGGTEAHTVYKHGIVMCDQSDTDGYFSELLTGTTVTNADVFGGIAIEKQNVASGDLADGSVRASCAVNGVWGLPIGSLAVTDLGGVAYATSDTVVTTGTSAGLAIGIIKEVDSSYAWVDIEDYAGKVSSTTT